MWHTIKPLSLLLTNPPPSFWRKIWGISSPPKVKHFFWRIINNAIASGENLFQRNCSPSPPCSVCGNEIESIEHILWRCDGDVEVWVKAGLHDLVSVDGGSVGKWMDLVLVRMFGP